MRKDNPRLAAVLDSIQTSVNDVYRTMREPSEVTEFTVTDPVNGKQIAWIGGTAKGGVSYSGAAFANLWVGPNADPATAPILLRWEQCCHWQERRCLCAGSSGKYRGYSRGDEEPAKMIAAATNAAPSVVTIAAHGYINGDTLLIAGAAGNTAINGYRIVQGVTANTFTLTDPLGVAINGNGVLSGAPTAIRYYAGVLAQVFAIAVRLRGTSCGRSLMAVSKLLTQRSRSLTDWGIQSYSIQLAR